MITQSNVMKRWMTARAYTFTRAIRRSDSIVRAGGDGGLGTRSESSSE